MKKVFILIALIFISGSLFSQAWMQYLPQNRDESELTFFDYQAAFKQWCQVKGIDQTGFYTNKRGEKQKAYGWKQFKRWEIQMDGWYDRKTGRFLYHEVNEEILRVKEQRASNPRNIGGNWTSVAYSQEGSGNDGNGRINCIAFHPTDPDVFWVGTAWGGIWKTEDHGNSWTPLSDEIMTLGIGSIAIPFNYDQTQTIYLGTGDRGYNRDYGRGILKSTDGGQTWQQTGLSYDTILPFYINKLMFVPGTANQLIACTDEGIFSTDDGFQTWDTLLTCFGMDMEFNPGNPNIIYVSTRGVNKNTKIYRTDNGGVSWNVAMSTYGCRTELAVSPDEPSWVYAVVADTSESFKEFLKSTNNGISFGVVYDDYNILGGDCNGYQDGGQASYDLAIAASPSDANLVFVGGINVWKSTTGGTTWSINTNGYDNCGVTMSVHVDIHWLDYQELTNELFVTSDGGIYFSANDGFSYTNISGGLQINQPYKISCSQLSYDEILMGQQDNGIALWDDGEIDFVGGGDGGTTLINPLDANNQYYSNNNSDCYFTTNHWASTHTFTTPGDNTNSWFKPIVIRPPDSVYYGAHDLWMSDEKGYNMTKIMDLQDTTTIHRIAVAPTNPNIIFVVNKEHLWRTQTGGFTVFDLNANLPVSPGDITNIEIKENDPDIVWISAADEWGTGNGVFRSADRGMTWTNISAGLPECPIADVIQNDLQTGYEELYACCWFGTYIKLGDYPWMPYNNGQPDVISFDIDIYYAGSNSKLRAGTHGRGVWESDLFSADNSQPFVWTGNYNSDWNDFRNWNYMTVPSTDVDVILPQGTARNAHIYTSNAYCRNIVIESGARLNISDRQLVVSNDMEISDELKFFGELARIMVEGNIYWKNGSSFEASDTACVITVSGDWTFETGAQADLTGTIVKFNGSDFSNLYSNSSGSRFGRLVVNKPAPYSLSFEDPSSEDLVIMDDLIVSANCKYYQNSVRNLNVLGDLYAEGDFNQQHGNYRCKDSASLKLVKSSSYLNNFFIDNSSLITLLSNIKIRGNLDIRSGILNADSYEVNLWGDLYRDNTGLFSMTTGRLTFSGTNEQSIWDDYEIKTVEINKVSDTLRIPTGRNIVFENFDWTSGAIALVADSHVEMGELIDDGICGSYIIKTNAILDIYNPTGSVDLNGKLVISGGTVNVYGGNHASYWPGSANAELHLSSGTLDFKDRGIYVLDHPTLTFLDNITGGVIRTSGSFQGDHHSFNPAGGYIELYGEYTEELGHGIGSSFYKIVINKGVAMNMATADNEIVRNDDFRESPDYEKSKMKAAKPRYRRSPPPQNTRANKVTVWDNLDIDDNLVIIAGELDINGKTVDVTGSVDISGSLTLTNATSVLNAGAIEWNPGSAANITEGLITFKNSWHFMNGTNATLTLNNTVKAIGTGNSDVYHKDPDACFANFVAEKSSGSVSLDNVSLYPMQVNGNMTVKNGSTLRISASDLVVGGTFLTESTAGVEFINTGTLQAGQCEINNTFNLVNGSTLTTDGLQIIGALNLTDGGSVSTDDLDLEGILDINAGSVLVHNNFTQAAAGHLIIDGGSFVIDKPYTGSMFSFSGTTDLNGGFFEISYEGIQFGTGAIVNLYGGNLRIGGHFRAVQPDSFKPVYGTVELINTIGAYIECNNGNFFHNLIINKSSGAGICMLAYPTTINVNLDIQSGELSTLSQSLTIGEDLTIGSAGKLTAGSSTITIGEDWMNNRGTIGFSEGTSSVWLETSQPCQISSETFYNLDLAKNLPFNQYANMEPGSTITILNKLTLGDGTLRMNNNCTLNLNGDLHLKSGGGLNANAAATGTVINVFGRWDDYNPTWSIMVGFASGQSTVYFRGAQAQEINATGGVNFYNLVFQKSAESVIPNNNISVVSNFSLISGQWRQAANNLKFTFKGNFSISDPALWLDQVNIVSFEGSNPQTLANNGSGWLNLATLQANRPEGSGTFNIISDVNCSKNLKVVSGEVAMDSFRLMCEDSLAVFSNGDMAFIDGVSIAIGNGGSIYINGGNLGIWGDPEDRATVTRSNTGYYELLVENGGGLEATYTDFEYMGQRGLNVDGTGMIAGPLPLLNCSFSNGEPGGTLLLLNNNQDLTLHNVSFPANTWSGANNISKSETDGNIYLPYASGGFAGPDFELDPNELIHWPSTGIWDGDVSTDWHDKDNWWYNYQAPTAGTDVIIPAGMPHYPVLSSQAVSVRTLNMEAATSLSIPGNNFYIENWAAIGGNLSLGDFGEDQIEFWADSIDWKAGSSADVAGKGFFVVEKDIIIRQGTNLEMTNGEFVFQGTGESRLVCHDTARIHNLTNNKPVPYSLSLCGDTLAQLTIGGAFVNGTGATLKCPSIQEWVFDGNFRNTANGHFRCANGTIRLAGPISLTYFRVKPGDYFNNLVIDTLVNLYYSTGYSDTLRVNGDLIFAAGTGGSTSRLTANAFRIMLRGDWINNAGSSAFVTGAGQTHQVHFWEPYERQEIRGNTYFGGVYIYNESDDGVHVYDVVNAGSIMITNPLYSHGSLTISNANIDDNLSAIHLVDGSTMQINALYQGGLIHVHNGSLTIEDLSQNYITGSYILDNGLMVLKQTEYTSTHDLYFANLTINGGELRFSGGNGLAKWPSTSGGVSTLTMTGGLFYLLNHSIEILPGNFIENITGGTIRLPGNFIADAGVTSFHPTGGTVELYDDWDVDCGFLEPQCTFYNLYVNKSGGASVTPFYGMRIINELKMIQGYMQLYGNPVIVGP